LNIYFLPFRIYEELALAPKTELALEIFTVLTYFLSFRNFEQLAFALKNRLCPGFTVISFIIQDFRATCTCPENRVCPEIFQARATAFPVPRAPMSRNVSQIFKLPSKFMQCGAKFQHATQTVGK